MLPDDPRLARHFAFGRLTWWIILGMALADALWLPFSPFSLVPRSFAVSAFVSTLLAGLMWFYRRHRFDLPLYITLECTLQLMVMTAVGAVFSYLLATIDLPLQDNLILQLDTWMGFSWQNWMAWLNTHPALADVLTFAYGSLLPQVAAVLLLLLFYRRPGRLQHFVFAATACALVSVVLGGLLPVVANYDYYHIRLADYPGLHPFAAFAHTDLNAIRDGTLHQIYLTRVQGIVQFPSYHTSVGVLLIYAAWPLRGWNIIFTLLNAAMIISTPADGGHYLADVIAGAAIALVLLALARRRLPLREGTHAA